MSFNLKLKVKVRVLLKIFLILCLTACEDDDGAIILPSGFTRISQDGNSYFILVEKERWGDKVLQRSVGMKMCKNTYKTNNYCEVYFFSNRADIPEKFPILNRTDPMGMYAMKYGKKEVAYLPPQDDYDEEESMVVLFKKLYKDYIWGKNVPSR